MLKSLAFELVREQQIPEINSLARLYRHRKTGAEVLSLINDDENKVFGITFKTPPEDSTGVAHILEHSVLCGIAQISGQEAVRGAAQGLAPHLPQRHDLPGQDRLSGREQNLQDFYNLVDVYLDAVFFPLITEDTFRQEGWHYELEGGNAPLVFKGVVFNEMKGAYSSPGAVLGKVSAALALSRHDLWREFGRRPQGDPRSHLRVLQELPREVLPPLQRAHRLLRRRRSGAAARDPRRVSQPVRADRGRCAGRSCSRASRRRASSPRPMPRARPSRARRPAWSRSTGCSTRSPTPRPCSRSTSSSTCWSAIPRRRCARR